MVTDETYDPITFVGDCRYLALHLLHLLWFILNVNLRSLEASQVFQHLKSLELNNYVIQQGSGSLVYNILHT